MKSEHTQTVDEIENKVYEVLKPLGFKKYGRTLHRFVDDDISQVVNFQVGLAIRNRNNKMWVNIGIRIPECSERKFVLDSPMKKYYREDECDIRSRLGTIDGKKEKTFSLNKKADKISREILDDICNKVVPFFNLLSDREQILLHRKNYPNYDMFNHLVLLDETMIYGRKGDLKKAGELFEKYCAQVIEENSKPSRIYMKKGQRILYKDQDITAEKSGYVTIYDCNDAHIAYLDELARELGIRG